MIKGAIHTVRMRTPNEWEWVDVIFERLPTEQPTYEVMIGNGNEGSSIESVVLTLRPTGDPRSEDDMNFALQFTRGDGGTSAIPRDIIDKIEWDRTVDFEDKPTWKQMLREGAISNNSHDVIFHGNLHDPDDKGAYRELITRLSTQGVIDYRIAEVIANPATLLDRSKEEEVTVHRDAPNPHPGLDRAETLRRLTTAPDSPLRRM